MTQTGTCISAGSIYGGAEWIRTAGSACSSESSRFLSVPLSPLAPVSADGENETGREPAMSISNQRDRQFESTPLHHPVHQFLYFSENRSKFGDGSRPMDEDRIRW